MFLLNGSIRVFSIAMAILSLTYVSGRYADQQFYDADFMQDDEIKFAKRLDDLYERTVASDEAEALEAIYFPVNPQNVYRIDGQWRVYNIINDLGQDHPQNGEMKMSLVGNGLVEVNQKRMGDFDLNSELEIAYLSDFDTNRQTIVLFMPYGNGDLKIEAEKIETAVAALPVETVTQNALTAAPEMMEEEMEEEKVQEPVTYVLTEVKKNADKLQFSATSAFVFKGQSVEDLVVTFEEKNQESTIEASFTNLMNGTMMKFEYNGEPASGLLLDNGADSKIIRMSHFTFIFKKEKAFDADAQPVEEKEESSYEEEKEQIDQNREEIERREASFEAQKDMEEDLENELMSDEELEEAQDGNGNVSFDFSQQ